MKVILFIMIGLSIGLLADFSRNNNTEIVTDNNTGLQWQDSTIVSNKTWIEAIEYCESLSLGGHSDWRLPNINELNSIIDRRQGYDPLDRTFQNYSRSYCWSSTTVADLGEDAAWGIAYKSIVARTKSEYQPYHVRCVRAGE